MKEDLIKLSREKGFSSRDNLVLVNKEYYYLWMCELQKWLREKHGLYVSCLHAEEVNNEQDVYFEWIIVNRFGVTETYGVCEHEKTFEQILEEGLLEALKLIEL